MKAERLTLIRSTALAALCAGLTMIASIARAAPQETATFTNVNSDDNGTTQGTGRQPGGPNNSVVTANFTGAYTAGKIHISGVLHDTGVGSFASEASWYVQPPSGPGILLTGMTSAADVFGDLTITGAVRSTATGIDGVITEISAATVSERGETRADERTSVAAMEDRKREGYF